jgi:hypothetical protein
VRADELEEIIHEAIQSHEVYGSAFGSVRTFSDAGVLSTDRGLVLRMSDGSKFHVIIVPSGGGAS